jgi:hypothetical protein
LAVFPFPLVGASSSGQNPPLLHMSAAILPLPISRQARPATGQIWLSFKSAVASTRQGRLSACKRCPTGGRLWTRRGPPDPVVLCCGGGARGTGLRGGVWDGERSGSSKPGANQIYLNSFRNYPYYCIILVQEPKMEQSTLSGLQGTSQLAKTSPKCIP